MAKQTEDWTGADIEALCRNAGINAIKKNYLIKDMKKLRITKEDFEKAMNELKKQKGEDSMPKADLESVKKMLPKKQTKTKKSTSKK
jgi:SpoVK/Ycf46/Vps4 family AAA+-type ATPase